MQVIRSLDELVTDIEDTGANITDQDPCSANPTVADLDGMLHQPEQQPHQQQQQQQQHLGSSLPDVMADMSRQLSEKFDLHDSFVGLMSM